MKVSRWESECVRNRFFLVRWRSAFFQHQYAWWHILFSYAVVHSSSAAYVILEWWSLCTRHSSIPWYLIIMNLIILNNRAHISFIDRYTRNLLILWEDRHAPRLIWKFVKRSNIQEPTLWMNLRSLKFELKIGAWMKLKHQPTATKVIIAKHKLKWICIRGHCPDWRRLMTSIKQEWRRKNRHLRHHYTGYINP